MKGLSAKGFSCYMLNMALKTITYKNNLSIREFLNDDEGRHFEKTLHYFIAIAIKRIVLIPTPKT